MMTKIWIEAPSHFQATLEVAACYVEFEEKLLLLERAAHCPEGKTWTAPAGKLDPGETAHIAAKRELQEETGIQVPPSQIMPVGKLYIEKPAMMYILHLFQVRLQEMPQIILSSESTRFLWVTLQEIETLPLIGGGHESFRHYTRMLSSVFS